MKISRILVALHAAPAFAWWWWWWWGTAHATHVWTRHTPYQQAYTFDKARDYVLELKDNLEHDTFVMATHDGKTVYKTFAGRVKLNRRRERVKGRRTGKVTLSVTHRGPTAEEDTDEREQLLPLYYTELEQGSTATADDGAAAPDEGTALNDTEQAASADEDNVGDES